MGAVFGKMTNVAAPLPSLDCVQPEEFIAIAQDSNGSEPPPRWHPFPSYLSIASIVDLSYHSTIPYSSIIHLFFRPPYTTYLYLPRYLPQIPRPAIQAPFQENGPIAQVQPIPMTHAIMARFTAFCRIRSVGQRFECGFSRIRGFRLLD